jgi:Patatin-like phospholipase
MLTQSNEEFQIGLTMSGAISAGAYTAGVFDFLIQALDEWERAREGKLAGVNPDDIPNHMAGIKVMSGASAGAITAAIGAVALADAKQDPVTFAPPSPAGAQQIKYYLPKLYDTWVVRPGLMAEGGQKNDFLTNSDLAGPPNPEDDFACTSGVLPRPPAGKPQSVTSLLNARLLDEIAKAGLDVNRVRETPRPYIAEPLHIYLTLSNLRGVPYKISFDGGDYHMISHGDRVHYAVAGLGDWCSPSAFADKDKSRKIDAAELVGNAEDKQKWKDYSICALASAAFPVGLAPREIGATLGDDISLNEYDGRRFPVESLIDEGGVDPDFTAEVLGAPSFWFTTADGGIIDNDPFEYARFTLKKNLSEPNETDLARADRAVIMVSPFPELKPIKPEGQPALDILSIFSALMPALIDQARFKPSELVLAADPNCGSRYLIGPSRVGPTGIEERYAIASGLLGGFGGFVALSFRDHDFQLGRRNCQRFLRQIFTVPPQHPIYMDWPQGAKSNPDFKAEPTAATPEGYCIIPLFGTARPPVPLPGWPRISQERFNALQERIANRFDYIAPALLKQSVKQPLQSLLDLALRPFPLGIGLIRDSTLKFVRSTILADLVRRDQIEGWELPATEGIEEFEIRLVLAELINPAYELRNISGLKKSTGLSEEKVKNVLALGQSQAAKGKPFEIWQAPWTDKAGGRLYTLASRKPSRLQQVFGVNHSGAWLTKPKVDAPGV